MQILKGGALSLDLILFAGPVMAEQPARPAPARPPVAHRDPNLISPDPDVRRGTLPNGLRYQVMHNSGPKGVVSIRLGIATGSVEEADDERGVAHFVEHMAFESTRNFAAGGIEQMFAARGAGFGRDQNAFTTLYSTTFDLDLPNADAAGLDLAFRWLRDVADGIDFTPAAVEREKGIVLAEKEVRSSANELALQQVIRFQAQGTRSVEREPIGTPESIRAMTPARLKAFYDRWYRPDNAVVIVVGDASADALEQLVRAGFASWTAKGAAPARAPVKPIDVRRGPDSLVITDPHLPTVVSACRFHEPDPRKPDDVTRLRRKTIDELWRNILVSRLSRVQNTAQPPYLQATVVHSDAARDIAGTCLVVTAIKDGWEGGLTAAQAEIRRFASEGPTDTELEVAVEDIRSQYRGEAVRTSTRQSGSLADQLLKAGLEGDVTPAPPEAFRAFDVAVEDLTPGDIKAGFARGWSGSGPLLVLLSPDAQDRKAVLAAWNQGLAAPSLGRYVDSSTVKWAYGSFGRAGRVVRRQAIATGDFVRLTYRNGVVLNFKHLDVVKNNVGVSVRFGSGRRDIPNPDYFTAAMAAAVFEDGGVGRHDYSEINGLFSNGGWGAKLTMLDDAFVLHGSASANSLGDELSILSAYLTDPGFSTKMDAVLPTVIDAVYRSYRTRPHTVMDQALTEAVDPDSPSALPPRETLIHVRSANFAALLKPIVTQAPIEVTIVGDVDEKAAADLVASTLGALPARKVQAPARTDTRFTRFPDRPIAPIHVTHEGYPDKALVGVVWPLYVATPKQRREEVAIILMSKVLSDRLLHRIRQEMGKAYAPEAETSTPDNGNQGYLIASVEAYPADIGQIEAEIRKAAERLAQGDISAEDLEQVRKPALSGLAARSSTIDWWLSTLDGSARDPEQVKDQLGLADMFAAVSLGEVRKAAADWLSRQPIVVVATPAADRAKAGAR